MNNIKIMLIIFISIGLSLQAVSQESGKYLKLELKEKLISQNSGQSINFSQKNFSADKKKEKSPYLGAAFSSIIPGSGEFYAQSYIKAGIFFAIEAGLWFAYASYDKKGDDQEAYYQNFANNNWDVYKYAGWLKDESFPGSEGIDLSSDKEILRRQINACEAQNFSHQLPPYGEQQYYELIGKYQNFVPGWADADLNVVNRNNYGTYKTNMFVNYSYDRQKANDYYNKRSAAASLVIVNHLLSAADAAWSVSMFNKDIKIKTSLHIEDVYSYDGNKFHLPFADLQIIF